MKTLPSNTSTALVPVDSVQETGQGLNANPSPMSVRRFLTFLRKYWWVPTLTVVCCAAAAVTFIFLTPPVYTSAAAMWETEKLHLTEGALFTDDPQTYIGTQIELLKSQRMWQATIERLRASGTNAVPLGKDGLPMEVKLGFKEAPKSAVFVITATSADAAYSKNFLDNLMNEYLDYKKAVRKLVSGDTAASISAQVESLERDLKTAQDALTSFQHTNNLAVLQEESSVSGNYLARLQTDLSDLQLRSQLLQASMVEQNGPAPASVVSGRDPNDLVKNLGLGESNTAANDDRLTPYQELEMLKIQRANLSKYLRPKHPKIAALDEQIGRAEKLVEIFRSQSREQIAAAQKAVKMKTDSVVESIKVWEAKVVEANSRIAEAERLKLDVTRAQSLYDRLATLLQNVDITRNTDLETLAILEQASPAKASYRLAVTASIMALLAGLLSGLGVVFLIERRDDRFTCVRDVQAALGDAVVALVPHVAVKKKQPVGLLEKEDPRHEYAEAYRRLRSALVFLPSANERPKLLLVTSAVPGEGKSSVVANLTRALALSGSRVLVVDGDLRRGHLHQWLNLKSEPGLTELLQGACEPDDVLQRDGLPNLAFVACGARARNPSDLFLSARFDEALARWRRAFDYVIIDSTPLFAADDASCMAPKTDGALLVVRRGHSSARAVTEALDFLAQRQAGILGVVFNGADLAARDYYYDKHGEYSGVTAKSA